MLGDDPLTSGEVEQLQSALAAGRSLNVSITDFVVRAISLAGGRCRRQDGRVVVAEVPASWVGGRVLASYEALYSEPDAAPSGTPIRIDPRRGSSAGSGGDPLGPRQSLCSPGRPPARRAGARQRSTDPTWLPRTSSRSALATTPRWSGSWPSASDRTERSTRTMPPT